MCCKRKSKICCCILTNLATETSKSFTVAFHARVKKAFYITEKCDDLFRGGEERQRDTHKEIEFVFRSEKDYFVQGTFCVPNKFEKLLPVAHRLFDK